MRRVNSQKEAFPVVATKSGSESFVKLLRLLAKEKTLPKRRRGLEGKIKGWFQKIPDEERTALTLRLLQEGYVKEEKAVITYFLKPSD